MSHRSEVAPLISEEQPRRCCSLGRFATPLMWSVALGALLVAAFTAGRLWSEKASETSVAADAAPLPLINATAAVTGEKYSMATGFVSEDAEGLFVLDHNSGLLQCSVIYPRLGQFMGRFTINVADALGTGGKGGQYMMVTGRAEFPRASNRPAASTVVYVMDTATGNYACYGIPFDRVAMNANRQQQGVLVLIATGSANPVIDRDNLR